MILALLYLTVGGLVALPLSDSYRGHTSTDFVLATAITVLLWPLIILNAIALICAHWKDL